MNIEPQLCLIAYEDGYFGVLFNQSVDMKYEKVCNRCHHSSFSYIKDTKGHTTFLFLFFVAHKMGYMHFDV